MRLAIDSSRCEGHGRCASVAPGLFEVDDYGMSYLVVGDVPGDQEGAAAYAVDACPEQAIAVRE